MTTRKKSIPVSVIGLSISLCLMGSVTHAAVHTFPVVGSSSFSNDFTAPRSNGQHNAIDIIANKRQPIVSATDGTITYVAYPQPSYGYMIRVVSTGGYTYDYIHINNDNPGTDDGKGGAMNAYAPGVQEGNPVKKGQLLGWVGDSGNAETTVSHLHYEVRTNQDKPYNPYDELRIAKRISNPVTAAVPSDQHLPYGESKIALNVALGDIDNDGALDTVVGTGRRASPRIKVYNSSEQRIVDFPLYNEDYKEGVDIASGDVDGDDVDEVVAVARTHSGTRVWAYKYQAGTLSEIAEFTAFADANSGGRITTGDIDGNGTDEIIVGRGSDGNSEVKVYNTNGSQVGAFNGYSSTYKGGVDVAAGDVSGDTKDEIVVSRLSTGTPLVNVFNQSYQQINSFLAHGNSHTTGVRVSVGNVITGTQKSEIVTVPNGGNPKVRTFTGTGNVQRENYFIEEWWKGYYDVAAGQGAYREVTGYNRRASLHY